MTSLPLGPATNPYPGANNPYARAVAQYLQSQGIDPNTAAIAGGSAAQAQQQPGGLAMGIGDGAKLGMMMVAKKGAGALKGAFAGHTAASAASPVAGATEASQAAYGGNAMAGEAANASYGGNALVTGTGASAGTDAAAATAANTFPAGFGALPAAGVLAGAATGYEQIKGVQKAFGGGKLSPVQQAALFLPTFGLSAAYNYIPGLTHESTRDIAAKHTGSLLDQGKDNPAWQQYVNANRAQFNAAPPDPAHPFGDSKGNTFANFSDYKAHGLDAANLTGVYGNLKVAGPDWVKLTPQQQLQFTQYGIDNDLYKSKGPDVVITDEDKARSYLDSMLKGTAKAPASTPLASTPALGGQTLQIARSQTSSPGIGKNGMRVKY